MRSRYEIFEKIGRGGMAVVHRAIRKSDGVCVALKIFDGATTIHRQGLIAKFIQEAKLLSTFSHPNLVKVLDYGVETDGRPWLAMELIEGEGGGDASLAARLSSSRPITPKVVARLYGDLRAALTYCHAKGVVHGDVKIENVLLTADGTAKLSDFGIARVLDPETRKDCNLLTQTLEGNLGTPYVLAPECQLGAKSTPAADVYSLGVILFKLVTGVWYEGSRRLLREARTFAPEWAPLLERMLEVDPRRRISTAEELPVDPCACGRRRVWGRRVIRAACWSVVAVLMAFLVLSGLRPPVEAPRQATVSPRSDEEWGRHYFGTNVFDYVSEATLTRTNRLVLTRPVLYGTLHLPDTNGAVEVESPPGYEGFLILARHVEGDMFYQMHVRRVGALRVRASSNSIRVANRPFPRTPDTGN